MAFGDRVKYDLCYVPVFLSALLAIQALAYRNIPEGSMLHVKLTCAVGSFASRPGAPVAGVLIAPVKSGGETVLPAGSMIYGHVKSVRRIGYGVIHEAASLDLVFDAIALPGGAVFPAAMKLVTVDTGREEVTPRGTIREARSTSSWGNHVAGYIRSAMLLDVHVQIAAWAVKSVIATVPEPEIYLPSGTELTLALISSVRTLAVSRADEDSPQLSEDENESLAPVISDLPERSFAPRRKSTERPADLVNLLFIGSPAQIATAFTAAGWTVPRPDTFRSGLSSAFAIAFDHGDRGMPMSPMRINGVGPDMTWEKGFNDVSKRHHIRLWKLAETWHGQNLWVGAATRDVEIGYLRSGKMMTHRVEELVDHERDKIAYDLTFATCADALEWWDRPNVPRLTRNATGDRMETDGQLAVLRLNDCDHPREITAVRDTLPVHGKLWQRIVRREVLNTRNELLRANIYWKGYEGFRFLMSAVQNRRRIPEPDAPQRPNLASKLQPTGLTSVVSFR